MKLALFQMKMSKNSEENLSKSIWALKEAAGNKADLIIYPELQLYEFFPQYEALKVSGKSTTLDGDIVKQFCLACKENHIMAVPNIYLKENGKYYDASLLIDKHGKIMGCQKMVHIAQADKFYEQDYYAPSDDGFHVFDTEFGQIGIVICFDRHYPESIRTESLKGAELILIPTANTLAEQMEMFEWEVKVQASQNSVAIAMCNRVGTEDKMEFAGESLVVDADGNTRLKAGGSEQLIYADIDLSQSLAIRSQKSYMNLRRIEWYI